jgi:hypothetical protein
MVLHPQHHGTAGVVLGANQGHAGGLTVPLVFLPRSHQVINACPQCPRKPFEIPGCQVIWLRFP